MIILLLGTRQDQADGCLPCPHEQLRAHLTGKFSQGMASDATSAKRKGIGRKDEMRMRKAWKDRLIYCGTALAALLFMTCVMPAGKARAAENAPYGGIRIDGDFSDWAGVEKHPAANGVNEVAFLFDGDYLYVYIDEPTQAFSATWSGTHGNGKFVVVTDLGYQTLFQLTHENGVPGVAGVEGALCAHSDTTWGLPGYYWEIAIPASNLQPYQSTVSFGHYLADGFYVSNVANLSGGSGQPSEPPAIDPVDRPTVPSTKPPVNFDGILYDGNYDDWIYYPHTLIEYATSGTQVEVPDAEAALYSVDGVLFGHVATAMPPHMNEGGGEFTAAVTIQINKNAKTNFYPQYVTVDAGGNVNYDPQLQGLPVGTYEFCIIDSQGWKGASNVSQWSNPEDINFGHNAVYGYMLVTVGPSQNNMEYWVNVSLLADRCNMEADNVHVLSAQYGRIGQQWVHTAGTSTGPVLGIVLCVGVVGCSLIHKKYDERKRKV